MKKSYEEYLDFCKTNAITKDELINSKFYQFLISELNLVENETLLIAKIESLALKSNPSCLRIRNDRFLKLAKAKALGGLITGIKIKDKQYYLFFSTKYFFNYHFNTNKSNSFITFDYDDLVNNWTIYPNDTIIEKNYHKNYKMYFYVSTDDNFDAKQFNAFNQKITKCANLVNQEIRSITPPIADLVKKNVRTLYQDQCGLSNQAGDEFVCPSKEIDLEFLKTNDLNYTDIHHFAPKDFLAKLFKNDLNWSIIHDEINLIPLCSPCHVAIHKGKNNVQLVTKVFQAIIKSYQNQNRWEDFIKYLKINFNLNVDDLLKVYLKTY